MDRFKEIDEFLTNLINKEDTIVVAVSGGPDSMCLLKLLIDFRNKSNINIICAHVNHNVREESDNELIFVRDYCNKNNITFECTKIESYSGHNFESEARDKRYNFFKSIISKYNASYLLTAHHGDDLMETILMRIVRGSNLKGYSGFSRITDNGSYKTIRPLINLTKDQILQYNKENNIPYVEDYTNFLDTHTRNRYRKYILPRLKMEDKNVNDKFLKFSSTLLEYNNYIDKLVVNKMDYMYINNTLDINKFRKEDHIIQLKIISNILSSNYKDDINFIEDKNINILYKLITSTNSNKQISLPLNKIGIKSYDSFYIIDKNINKPYKYTFDKKLILPNGKKVEQIDNIDSNSNYICRINSNDIVLPLIIRTRENGDKMTIKNLNGSKKIKDILIDSKVNLIDRQLWPVVTDSKNNIVWLPGLKKSKYDKQKDEKYDIILRYY